MNAKEYAAGVEVRACDAEGRRRPSDIALAIERAFKAGVTEGRRRHQGYLSRLIKKGQWAETGLPLPERDERLPGYHDLLNYLCDKLRVCGAVTFWQAVENVNFRLAGR